MPCGTYSTLGSGVVAVVWLPAAPRWSKRAMVSSRSLTPPPPSFSFETYDAEREPERTDDSARLSMRFTPCDAVG